MPYIKTELRAPLDRVISVLQKDVLDLTPQERDGALVYIITELVAKSLKPADGWRWKSLKDAHGCFTAAGDEFSRRLIGPYEDQAKYKNGDISAYRPGP